MILIYFLCLFIGGIFIVTSITALWVCFFLHVTFALHLKDINTVLLYGVFNRSTFTHTHKHIVPCVSWQLAKATDIRQ